MDSNYVTIDKHNLKIVEHTQDSVTYPGLVTMYRKRVISATLNTMEKPQAPKGGIMSRLFG